MSTSSAPNSSGGNNSAQSRFTPPGGGDITLRSSDGVDFLVHSTILKFASSVFSDMITTGTTKDTVNLTEDAIGVSYLLRFIYPNRLPLIIGADALPICLEVVRKYDVEGALDIIDQLIVLDTSPHKLLSSDPIRAYQLATQFNLVQTRISALRLITAGGVDFCDLNKVSELAQKYSSPGLVYLMNIQAMRVKVLSDILFKFDSAAIQPPSSNPTTFTALSCTECRTSNPNIFNKFPPPWALAWLRLVYETLLTSSEPLAKSDYLFKSTVLDKFKGREDVCRRCLSDYNLYPNQRPIFDRWAGEIKKVLEVELAKLELVYAL